MKTDEFLTTKMLADRLNVTEKTIYRWRVNETGPPWFKLGGGLKSTVYYRLKDVLKWERSQGKIKK